MTYIPIVNIKINQLSPDIQMTEYARIEIFV